jgi:DNA-binding transcriptional MerR regulator
MQEQKTYTKNEISQKLGVQSYIITLWEKQFGIETTILHGQQMYSEQDEAQLASIKELLYEKGYSIAAAKKFLQEFPMAHETGIIAASPLLFESSKAPKARIADENVVQELLIMKDKLLKLKERI